MINRIYSALMVTVLATGCMNNGIEWSELSFTRKKPAANDLIGVWQPTTKTKKDIIDNGHYPNTENTIILRADGTFSITNMPDWSEDGFGESKGKSLSYTGTWQLDVEKMGPWSAWSIWFKTENMVFSYHLSQQKAPYFIYITLGDPDSGHHMLFNRVKMST